MLPDSFRSGDRRIDPNRSTQVTYGDAPTLIHCGHGHTAIVDARDYELLRCYSWRTVRNRRSFYAVTEFSHNGKRHKFHMSRMVADTPDGYVCHHRNRNSLDNRLANLLNLPPKDHRFIHLNDTLLIQSTIPQNSQLIPTPCDQSTLPPTGPP